MMVPFEEAGLISEGEDYWAQNDESMNGVAGPAVGGAGGAGAAGRAEPRAAGFAAEEEGDEDNDFDGDGGDGSV
ncbi:hypothetical protein FJY94_08785 [Candidatus Kaiserbacteria bacterium]|nr:hypothetical protein [Candidatus Kaiserbacteria bacterium]